MLKELEFFEYLELPSRQGRDPDTYTPGWYRDEAHPSDVFKYVGDEGGAQPAWQAYKWIVPKHSAFFLSWEEAQGLLVGKSK
jgi:hypothetical protein